MLLIYARFYEAGILNDMDMNLQSNILLLLFQVEILTLMNTLLYETTYSNSVKVNLNNLENLEQEKRHLMNGLRPKTR